MSEAKQTGAGGAEGATALPVGSSLDRIEALLAAQRQHQQLLGKTLQEARAQASGDGQPATDGAVLAWTAGGALALLLCTMAASWWWSRRQSQRRLAARDVDNYFADSSQLSTGYGENVPLVDAMVQRFATPQSQPVEDLTERIEGAALRPVAAPAEHLAAPVIDESIDIDLCLMDDGWEGMAVVVPLAPELDMATASAAPSTGDVVSEEVQKVLKSLAEKRQTRSQQLLVIPPLVVPSFPLHVGSAEETASPIVAAVAPPVAFKMAVRAPILPMPPAPESTLAMPAPPVQVLTDTQWQTQLDLALELVKLEQYDEAIGLYQEVIAQGPEAIVQKARRLMTFVPPPAA